MTRVTVAEFGPIHSAAVTFGDLTVFASCGWQDLDPQHGFYQSDRGQTRYTVTPGARKIILRNLLDLNLERANEGAE